METKRRFSLRSWSIMAGLLLVALLAALVVVASAAGDKKVAVLELVNKAGVTDDEAYFLTDKVRRTASQTLPISHFTIMTSENIQELLPPGKDLAKCTEAQCEVELGREIGAEYIITGEIIRYAGKLRVQVKVHHVPTGHFIGSEDTKAGSLEEQEGMLTAISSALMGKVLTHAGVAAPARAGGGAVFVSPTQPSAPSGAAEVKALAPSEQPPATATGPAGIYITSKPTGADVYLGQTMAGTTSPAFQKMSLQPGTTVRVTLKMPLYHDVSFDVALVPGVMKFEGVELKPAFGSLKIETEPTGAEVFIGGKNVGTSPFSQQRHPSGQYLVTVKKEWYLPQEDQQITVTDGQATNKVFTLSQDFGTLDVQSNPAGADVTLDGKKLGTTPGSWRVPPVASGKIEIAKAAHRSKSFEIKIDRNQTVKITAEQATLTAKVGSLQVYADPPEQGAKVFVDGKEVGTAPITVSDLLEGPHEVKVETADKVGTATVTIQEGQTAVAAVTLKAKVVVGMARIPAGWFVMGCSPGDPDCQSDEKPNKRVYVDSFYMDTHEVTQAEYERVVGTNPSYNKDCPTCPVEKVSWNDARSYCAKVGKRLPTEAEWEYAARGGTTGARYGEIDAVAWYWEDSSTKLHPVGQKQPNAYGLYDMLGNVWEWCEDWYDKDWYSRMPERNPRNDNQSQDRVLRGGSWLIYPRFVRASVRYSDPPTFVSNGFRCSRD